MRAWESSLCSALFPSAPDGSTRTLVRSPLLYHGTRDLESILSDGYIRVPATGDRHVSLTTDFRVALYWASLPRDGENEVGGIIVFDRQSLLASGHNLFAFDGTGEDDEAELACPRPIDLLDGALTVLRFA